MHAIKGAWIGQTFALAKGHESSGRKSRIRRSKEERKEMVESFIKTYQIANNGSFPSLNLTHKEVGGSFYTVREIVREVIQENRVLGPGKLTLEEVDHSDELFWDKHPLGSISVEPEIVLQIQPSRSHVVSEHCEDELDESLSKGLPLGSEHQKFDERSSISGSQVSMKNETDEAKTVAMEVGVSKNLVEQKRVEVLEASPIEGSLSNELPVGSEHQKFDEMMTINGSQVSMKNETDEAKTIPVEVGVTENLEEEKYGEVLEASPKAKSVAVEAGVSEDLVEQKRGEVLEASYGAETVAIEVGVSEHLVEQKPCELVEASSAVSQLTADVIVENFPIRPARKLTDSVVGSSSEVIKADQSLKQKDIGKLDYIVENSGELPDDLHSSNNSSLEAEKRGEKVVDSSFKEYDSVDSRVENLLEPPQEISDHLIKPTTTEQKSDSNAALRSVMSDQDILTSRAEKSSRAIAREVPSSPKSISQKHLDAVFSRGQPLNRKEEQGGNQTSDRTYLKSRGASQAESSAAAQQEETDNPLWSIFKSFVVAFVKFWSE